jgi:thiol:disulfide interchange protein
MSERVSSSFGSAVLILLVIVAFASCTKEKEEAEVAGDLEWLTSFDRALQIAQQKSKPIMIDFYADWCGWCKRLDSDTYAHKDVISKAGDFISLKIDADIERGVCSKYRIAGLPTILFLDHTGKEIHRVVGYRQAGKFVQEMDAALAAYKEKAGRG